MKSQILIFCVFVDSGIDENACILMKYKNGSMASLTYHTDAGLGPNTGIIMGQKGLMEVKMTLEP